ncbi:hypothetical protein GCM10027517_20750 [Phycicoccus ginsengisoli]
MASGQNGVEDRALAEEIVLLGELMAAAAQEEQHLTQEQVDEVLGLAPGSRDPQLRRQLPRSC